MNEQTDSTTKEKRKKITKSHLNEGNLHDNVV